MRLDPQTRKTFLFQDMRTKEEDKKLPSVNCFHRKRASPPRSSDRVLRASRSQLFLLLPLRPVFCCRLAVSPEKERERKEGFSPLFCHKRSILSGLHIRARLLFSAPNCSRRRRRSDCGFRRRPPYSLLTDGCCCTYWSLTWAPWARPQSPSCTWSRRRSGAGSS